LLKSEFKYQFSGQLQITSRDERACSPKTGAPDDVESGGRLRQRSKKCPECSAPKGAEGMGRKHYRPFLCLKILLSDKN
jgi:hypothetical protein